MKKTASTALPRMWPFSALVFATLLPTCGLAADWYWRPAGKDYGRANGTSYSNAWSSDQAIRWDRMRPGDRLLVCGKHDRGYLDRKLIVKASGVTITGACGSDPGSIVSTGRPIENWTTSAVPGVFHALYSGLARTALDSNLEPLKWSRKPLTGSSRCGSFYSSQHPIGILSIKPCQGIETVYPQGDAPVILIEADDVVVENLSLMNAGRLIEVRDSDRVTLRNLTLRHAKDVAIHLTGSTRSGEIQSSNIAFVGNGIYASTRAGTAESHDDWLVEGNTITDVRGNLDAHGIGWQVGSRNQIRQNRILRANTGITFYRWADALSGSIGNTIEANEISEMRRQYADPRSNGLGRGIEFGGDNCPPSSDLVIENTIRWNSIRDVDDLAVYVKVPMPATRNRHSLDLYGNLSDSGLRYSDIDLNGRVSDPPNFRLGSNDFRWISGTDLAGRCES